MGRTTTALTATLATLVLLAGCGRSDDGDADGSSGSRSGSDSGSSAAAQEEESAQDPCEALAEADYTGADFGTVATWEPLENVTARVDHLAAITDVPAPEGLEQEWELRIGYIERLQTLIDEAEGEQLPMDLASAGDEEDAAGQVLTDWWFESCQ